MYTVLGWVSVFSEIVGPNPRVRPSKNSNHLAGVYVLCWMLCFYTALLLYCSTVPLTCGFGEMIFIGYEYLTASAIIASSTSSVMSSVDIHQTLIP